MKKTIITLLALSCVSMGATIGEIDTTDTTLKAYWDFASSSAPTVGSANDWLELPTWNAAGYGECTYTTSTEPPISTHPYTTVAGLKVDNGFTVSFDINDAGAGTLLSMTSGGGMGALWRSVSVTLAASTETPGASIISAQFLGDTSTAVSKTLTLSDTDWTTLTLVGSVDSTVTTTIVLDFYIDGEHVGTSSTANAANFTSETINRMQFGHLGEPTSSATTNIDNILVYGRALSATEVKALTVPEPATATLSLLALAGLAARRRRK